MFAVCLFSRTTTKSEAFRSEPVDAKYDSHNWTGHVPGIPDGPSSPRKVCPYCCALSSSRLAGVVWGERFVGGWVVYRMMFSVTVDWNFREDNCFLCTFRNLISIPNNWANRHHLSAASKCSATICTAKDQKSLSRMPNEHCRQMCSNMEFHLHLPQHSEETFNHPAISILSLTFLHFPRVQTLGKWGRASISIAFLPLACSVQSSLVRVFTVHSSLLYTVKSWEREKKTPTNWKNLQRHVVS